MNYKVILVDDEEEILKSIRKKLNWGKYGFEVVGAFQNGRDVLDFLENQEADIVITDIRMPFMDGISLAGNIYSKYPQIKVVILSGYSDFNYAKEAMAYKVTDYILKPVNVKEMEGVMQKMRQTLDLEMSEKKNVHLLERQYQESLPAIRENLLNKIVSGNVGEENIEEELDKCAVGIGHASCWTAALIQIDKIEQREGEEPIERQFAFVYVCGLLKERFESQIPYAAFYNSLGECVLFGMDSPEQMGKILFRLNDAARESRKVMGIQIAVGVGKVKDRLLDVKQSFEESREALLYRKMTRDGDVIYMEDISLAASDVALFDEPAQNSLFTAVKFGEAQDICKEIRGMRMELKRMNMRKSAWQAYCISVLNALLGLMQQWNIEIKDIFGGIPDYLKLLGECGDADMFFEWLERHCIEIGKRIKDMRNNKARNIIEIAQEHMRRRYGEQDISLENVAMEIGLTPNYFSSLFKKETGESFVEYLTDLRMKEALRLLDHTEEKIYLIAQKTGYPDAGYFSHVFKKKYGISPIQYRRQSR